LDANLLYLANADYGKPYSGQSSLFVLNWAQYVLDKHASADEAVRKFEKNQFHMEAKSLPDGIYLGVHLSLSDSTGDNAIFEYIEGKLVVFHNKK
jgi:penicillin V acylase-like amidase (Ntn superfamily)